MSVFPRLIPAIPQIKKGTECKVIRAIKKIQYELALFLIMAFRLPVYSYGYHIAFSAAFCVVFACFLGQLLRCAEKEDRVFWYSSIILFMLSDIVPSLIYIGTISNHLLSLKTAVLLSFILAVEALIKKYPHSERPAFRLVIPFLCAFGIAAEPFFFFLLFPIVILLLAAEKIRSKSKIVDFSFYATLISGLFIRFVVRIVQIYTGGFNVTQIAIKNIGNALVLRDIAVNLARYLPLILFFVFLWSISLKGTSNNKPRWLVRLCFFSPVSAVVLNVFFKYSIVGNWNYYFNIVLFTQFILLFYFMERREMSVLYALKKITETLKKNLYIALLVLTYIISVQAILFRLDL